MGIEGIIKTTQHTYNRLDDLLFFEIQKNIWLVLLIQSVIIFEAVDESPPSSHCEGVQLNLSNNCGVLLDLPIRVGIFFKRVAISECLVRTINNSDDDVKKP